MKKFVFCLLGVVLGGALVALIIISPNSANKVFAASGGGSQCADKGDNDNDGVKNCNDKCPDLSQSANGAQPDPVNPGCPLSPDTDSDGYPDSIDNCPAQYAYPADEPGRIGCPPNTTPTQCPNKDPYVAPAVSCPDFPVLDGKNTSVTTFAWDSKSVPPNCKYNSCQLTYHYKAVYSYNNGPDQFTGEEEGQFLCSLLTNLKRTGNLLVKSINSTSVNYCVTPAGVTNSVSQQSTITQPAAPAPTNNSVQETSKKAPPSAMVGASNSIGLLFNRLFSW